MIKIHILGYPRIGVARELKFATEGYWSGKHDLPHLEQVVDKIATANWLLQQRNGMDLVTVGDLPLYDHVLETSVLLGNIPGRFRDADNRTDTVFLMGRGRAPSGTPGLACEMTKWFDTNYHYIVPEFEKETRFEPDAAPLLKTVRQARGLGVQPKPVIVGPATYLMLGKSVDPQFDRAELAQPIAEAYGAILEQIAAENIDWIQLDEPVLTLDLGAKWHRVIRQIYQRLTSFKTPAKIGATYFGGLGDNTSLALELPFDVLHVDLTRSNDNLTKLVDAATLAGKTLSLGVVDGRNVWRADLGSILNTLKPIRDRLGDNDLWLAPSCSLLHVPCDLRSETKLDPRIKECMAFAVQKLDELVTLRTALVNGEATVADKLKINRAVIKRRRDSEFIHNQDVARRLASVGRRDDQRQSAYAERVKQQRQVFDLPLLPTTTIGSFPQTAEIRRLRSAHRRGEIDEAKYTAAMRVAIKDTVDKQESYGLDVIVHGEPERNDMVEYFGELLDGMSFTTGGWVQSYGTRCVKPPLIYGDVSRQQPMTVDWIKYAQSLTSKPVKGMLTGPVTILQWSFVRDDQPRQQTCAQIALALRDELTDLEKDGIAIIQVDEPALREGMPLRKAEQHAYLDWATHCFRLAVSGVGDATQIHTHMCYSQFGDIGDAIIALDADVLTIESARSGGGAINELAKMGYPNEIGPGVYDIHSPNAPQLESIKAQITSVAHQVPIERLWINPDCGLKTRHWAEVDEALPAMVEAARQLRQEHAG